jgi:hypothetical protein
VELAGRHQERTYDGQPHPAAGSVTGVFGEPLGSPAFTYAYQDGDGNWIPTVPKPLSGPEE